MVSGGGERRHGSVKGAGVSDSTAMRALKPVLLCLAAVVAFTAAGFVQVVTAPAVPPGPMPTLLVAMR